MSSNIVSLGFLVSQNCTLMDFLPGADTMASHSKCMLMRSGHVLKRILVSDFLSPMESQIAFGSADIEAIERFPMDGRHVVCTRWKTATCRRFAVHAPNVWAEKLRGRSQRQIAVQG